MSDQPDRESRDRDVDLSAIGDTFKQLMGHMKGGIPVWEDFVARGIRFQRQMEQTITAFTSFMEGFGKIAELANHSKGTAGEIGAGLTNLAMWHKGQELRLREMNQALIGRLLAPLQGKIEEWKKTTTHFDREHEKEVQKAAKEIKEVAKTTAKVSKSLESKLKKDKPWEKCSALQQQLEQCQQETERKVRETEERERKNLSRVLVEERTWFCGFVTAFSWVLDIEVGMIGDLERLQAILKDLGAAVARPNQLPQSMQEFVETWVIPSSPLPRKRVPTHSLPSSSHEITAPIAPPIPALNSLPPPPPAPIPPPQNSLLPPPPSTFNPPYATPTVNPPYATPTVNPPYATPTVNHPYATATPGLNPPFPPPPPTVNPPYALNPPFPPPPPTVNPPYATATPGLNPPFPPPPLSTVNTPYAISMDPYNGYAPVGVGTMKPLPPLSDEPMTLAMSVSPSQASLMSSSSHQSTESSRSLSPPIAPTRSPVQSRAQLGGLQEEEPSSLQLEILSQLRQRAQSFEGARESPPTIIRTSSMVVKPTSSPLLGGRRPPPVALKPARNPITANGRQSPHLGHAHTHHVLNPTSLPSQQDSCSDSDEDESAFAKALRQKRLRKATQISDRSGPHISS